MNINTMAEEELEYKSYKLPVRLYPSKMRAGEDGKVTYHAKTMFRNKVVMDDIAKDLIVTGVVKDSSKDEILYIWNRINAAIKDRVFNGSQVDCGLGIMYARLNGSFESKQSDFDPELHTIDFGFRSSKEIKELAADVTPVIAQGKENVPEITSVYDAEGKENDVLTPDGDVIIKGRNIKIAGTNEDVGLYFENTESGTISIVKAEDVIRNTGTELICNVPQLEEGKYRLTVKTQRSDSNPSKTTLTASYLILLEVR